MYQDFDTFRQQTVIEGTLRNTTNLHIGGSEQDDNIKRLLAIKSDDQTKPYIPGTSLKGVFRTELERISRALDDSVCDPSEAVCDGTEGHYCVICGIFGGAGLAAHLRIDDALPKDNLRTSIKPQVALNRTTGTAENHYYIEVVDPMQPFHLKMIVENMDVVSGDQPRVNLIKRMLRKLLDGDIAVGGKSTAGMGSIRLEDVVIRIMTSGKNYKLVEKRYRCAIRAGALGFFQEES